MTPKSRTLEDWQQPEQRDVRNKTAPGRKIIPATAFTAWEEVVLANSQSQEHES